MSKWLWLICPGDFSQEVSQTNGDSIIPNDNRCQWRSLAINQQPPRITWAIGLIKFWSIRVSCRANRWSSQNGFCSFWKARLWRFKNVFKAPLEHSGGSLWIWWVLLKQTMLNFDESQSFDKVRHRNERIVKWPSGKIKAFQPWAPCRVSHYPLSSCADLA